MSPRISSSDLASASTSASLRCAYSATSAMATLNHIPTRRRGEASNGVWPVLRLKAAGETVPPEKPRTTDSVPGPRRRVHRRSHNVAGTSPGRIIATLEQQLVAGSGRFGAQTDTSAGPPAIRARAFAPDCGAVRLRTVTDGTAPPGPPRSSAPSAGPTSRRSPLASKSSTARSSPTRSVSRPLRGPLHRKGTAPAAWAVPALRPHSTFAPYMHGYFR